MKIKRRQIELILVLVGIAILANLINDFNFFTHNFYPVYNQMLFFAIGYICIGKLLDIRKKWTQGMVLGQAVLLFLCASLYYSKNYIDYLVYGITVYAVLCTIMYLRYERDKEEQ